MPSRPGVRLSVAVLSFSLCTVVASAQPATVGVRAGLSRSMFLGGEAHFLFTPETFRRQEVIRTQGGIEVGLFLRKPLSERFAIQPEIGYAMRGSEQTFTAPGGRRTYVDYTFGYVQAVVLVRYGLRTGAAPRIGVGGGPYLGVLATRTAEVVQRSVPTTQRDIDAVRSLDVGATVGADVALSARLHADLRLAFGFGDFVDEDRLSEVARSRHPGLHNAALVFGLYFLL